MFFKPKPNLPDAEKARIEFHLQQIAECVGLERFVLPVLSRNTFIGWYESKPTAEQIMGRVGDHLSHDVSGIRFDVVAQQGADCGGGGG